jgi:hypothetical protein
MKTISSRQIVRLVVLLLLVLPCTLHAQRIDTIKANPDAKPLRKIWEVTGGEFGGGRVGDGFGSVSDINGDSLEDWAVHYGTASEWHIFYGSRDEELSTTPVTIIDTIAGALGHPVVGDFWGTDHKAIGFPSGGTALRIFRTDSLRLDTVESAWFNPQAMSPTTSLSIKELAAGDLDNDGDDELIIFSSGAIRSGNISRKPEVWIFRGGPEFQVDTPTVILRDTEENDAAGYQMFTGRFDGDERPDLAMGFKAQGSGNKLSFWLSAEGSPWNWSKPDRVVAMGGVIPLDCDGDGLLDMATGGPGGNVSVFLSSTGKDIRTRSLASDDADLRYAPYASALALGFLSDSARRFQMLGILGEGLKRGFSGGIGGPDPFWDTYSADQWGGHQAIGDVTGDGWTEIMTGTWTVNFEAGYAAIYAGGPYIPRDPSLGVRAVTGEGDGNAISIWPNPVTTELHIAWRGDLQRMPRGYRIHDMNGGLVAEGETPSWRGEMLWQCNDVPAGSYVLSIYDWQWELLATTTITKV